MNHPHDETHDRDHEAVLRAALLSELGAEDPDLVMLLADCAECRRRWDTWDSAIGQLDAAGREERELLGSLRDHAEASDRKTVRRTLERIAHEVPPVDRGAAAADGSHRTDERRAAAPRSGWRWGRGLAAAAMLIGATFLAVQFLGSRPPEPIPAPGPEAPAPGAPAIYLGGDLPLLAPLGEVPRYGVFSWQHELVPNGSFALRIYDAQLGTAGPELLELELTDTTWTPPAKELERLPRAILWEVEALDAFGDIQASGLASASLSD